MTMESVLWLVICAALFVGLVAGGFWTIARAGLPRFVAWAFGAIVLIVICFALIYLVRGGPVGGPVIVR